MQVRVTMGELFRLIVDYVIQPLFTKLEKLIMATQAEKAQALVTALHALDGKVDAVLASLKAVQEGAVLEHQQVVALTDTVTTLNEQITALAQQVKDLQASASDPAVDTLLDAGVQVVADIGSKLP